MKFFATLFTALSLFSAPVYAEDIMGKAPVEVMEAQATKTSSHPDYRVIISSDFGGGIIDYIEKYNKLRQAGTKVQIDDLCMSACTMVTGLIPAENVCVSPYAIMAFHSAWVMSFSGPQHSKEGTALLMNIYPDKVREKLLERGWNGVDPHPEFIYFKGTDFYPLCN